MYDLRTMCCCVRCDLTKQDRTYRRLCTGRRVLSQHPTSMLEFTQNWKSRSHRTQGVYCRPKSYCSLSAQASWASHISASSHQVRFKIENEVIQEGDRIKCDAPHDSMIPLGSFQMELGIFGFKHSDWEVRSALGTFFQEKYPSNTRLVSKPKSPHRPAAQSSTVSIPTKVKLRRP